MNLLASVAKTFAFIPRLVVHKEEVDRIFHPQRQIKRNNQSKGDADESLPAETSIGPILFRGVVPDVSALRIAIRQMVSELPENMRTAPAILAKIAADLPSSLANMAIELPSNLLSVASDLPTKILTVASDLPTTIVSMAEGVEGTLETIVQISTDVAREVVELPHRASFEWKQLIWVLFLLVFAPVLIFGLVFFVPMNSVNDGIEHNRGFVYGTMTFYQLLTILPWIETCNFAMPGANISVKARLVTLATGIFVAKIYDALLVEGPFGQSIFPLPFSILVSSTLGVSGVVPLLYFMTPTREKVAFGRMHRVLSVYWISLVIVIGWAVGIQRLMHRRLLWQSAWAFVYGPLRFVCKIMLAAQITTAHNARRWIQLNLVVDILFTRVQVATFPFIESYITLMLLFSTEVLTLAWRYYNGIDRLALWWNAVWMAKANENKDQGNTSFGRTMTDITKGCFRAPISQIAQLNLSLREKNFKPDCIVRTLTGDTLFFDEEAPVVCDLSTCSLQLASELSDIDAACDMADKQVTSLTEPSNELATNCLELKSDETSNSNDADNLQTANGEDTGVIEQKISSRTEEVDVELCTVEDEEGSTITTNSNIKSEWNEQVLKLDDLSEEDWEQRPLYHVVDSTGAMVISVIVRINQQLSISMVRNLPSANHLNDSFQISDERWRKAQIYGWTFIALMLILLGLLACTFFRRFQGKTLSLSRIMSYLFKDHFWFFFLWLVSTGAFVCASMVNHFGADFSFRFKWISCPDQVAWPSCPM